ncbi:hypothetical protein VMCG_09498 [Cytospora schulzeri]|uniref:Exonuclease domain-containing protein n=1 Tax=Cytospora schulzeri TaxID=448051 RepID=A0A423VFP1_9PEZI|nr:hypothetical protein VMCG_09498 [Valsa malicola]
MAGPAGGPTSAVPLFSGLKHLPCPKEAGGGRCTTVACLFGHREEALNTSLDGADDGSQANEPPAKRQRTDTRKPDGDGRQGDGLLNDDGLPQQGPQSSIPPPSGMLQGEPAFADSLSANRPTVGLKRTHEGQQVSDGAVETQPVTEDQEVVVNESDEIAASDLYDPFSPPTPAILKKPTQPAVAKESPSLQDQPKPTTTSTSQVSKAVPQIPPILKTTKPPPTKTLATTKLTSSPAGTTSRVPASTEAKDDKSKSTPVKTRKPEALNPRHLQKAPAAHSVRLQLLKLLHAQFERLNAETLKKSSKDPETKKLGLVLSAQELIWMALDREQHLAIHKAAIYGNLLKQDVLRYKKMPVDDWIKERRKATEASQPEKKPAEVAAVIIKTGLTPDQEIEILKKRLITPIIGLSLYGYVPIPPSDGQIIAAKAAVEMSRNWEKCDRCTARFQVFPGRNIETGELASGGKCTHHPGRQYLPDRPKGDTSYVPKRYRCCEQDAGESPGCVQGNNHVWKTSDPKRLATLWNYAEAPANDRPNVAKAVCFDCEMGYTVYGMELIRVTATSWPDGAELLDVLVQPFGEILDLNSRYSGVWPEDLARGVSWTKDWKAPEQKPGERKILQKVSSPEVARDLLFSMISPDTVLIGHGLENDLNAMRIVHPKLVDTILLYPHRRGLPIRNSLKVLMEVNLNRRIQMDTGEGHDSAEDARAAGELARLKVQKEWSSMQSDGWKFVDGILREPGWKPEDTVDAEQGGSLLTEEFLEAL